MLPLAVWPEALTQAGQQVAVPGAAEAPGGFVLLRVYEVNESALAEGACTVRNQQVREAAFDYRRTIDVEPPAGTAVRYRLLEAHVLPVGADSTVGLPALSKTGWTLALSPHIERPGPYNVTHFAEVQAFLPARPPSARAEVTADLAALEAGSDDPIRWRHALEYAQRDLEAAETTAFQARDFLERQLNWLAAHKAAAFVPDGVAGPAGTEP